MKDRIIKVCNQLTEQGVKPTLEKVRSELGGGSFSSINPVLKQWKEEKEKSDTLSNIDLPYEITAIGQKATAMIWKAANDQCSEIIKAAKHKTDLLIEQLNNELNEALSEIERLESELENKNKRQDKLVNEPNNLYMKEEFRNWLITPPIPIKSVQESTAKSYSDAINKISNHYSENTGEAIDIYSLEDIPVVNEIALKYRDKQGCYRDYGKENNGLCAAAIARYLEFLSNKLEH
jgi:predicted RNase H-like nuclease (RuvC/YqgF family)